jgi:hypothetical protein
MKPSVARLSSTCVDTACRPSNGTGRRTSLCSEGSQPAVSDGNKPSTEASTRNELRISGIPFPECRRFRFAGYKAWQTPRSTDFSVSLTFMAPMRWPWCRHSLQNGLDWGASHSWQLSREKSLIAKRSEMKGSSGHTSKANFGNAFVSSNPPNPIQPVRPLWRAFVNRQRLRDLRGSVSGANRAGRAISRWHL